MSRIIIYGSEYGTAKKYADELSRRTGIEAVSFKDAADLSEYSTAIYIGAIYAGGVLGLAKTLKKRPEMYNETLKYIEEREASNSVFVIRPP